MKDRYEIRYAAMEDIHGMGRVYVDTWKAAYRGMIPQEFLDGLTASRWEDRYRQTLGKEGMPKAAVLLLDGQIIGVSSFMKTRDNDLTDDYGEIISIYVLPEYWHMGYGTLMLNWVTRELEKLGFTDCVLWTLEENLRAQRAYERFGFTRDGARKNQEFSGKDVWEIRYRKKILNLFDIAREENIC
jgi:RimJ/RimL family protein N-acetyltransferase